MSLNIARLGTASQNNLPVGEPSYTAEFGIDNVLTGDLNWTSAGPFVRVPNSDPVHPYTEWLLDIPEWCHVKIDSVILYASPFYNVSFWNNTLLNEATCEALIASNGPNLDSIRDRCSLIGSQIEALDDQDVVVATYTVESIDVRSHGDVVGPLLFVDCAIPKVILTNATCTVVLLFSPLYAEFGFYPLLFTDWRPS